MTKNRLISTSEAIRDAASTLLRPQQLQEKGKAPAFATSAPYLCRITSNPDEVQERLPAKISILKSHTIKKSTIRGRQGICALQRKRPEILCLPLAMVRHTMQPPRSPSSPSRSDQIQPESVHILSRSPKTILRPQTTYHVYLQRTRIRGRSKHNRHRESPRSPTLGSNEQNGIETLRNAERETGSKQSFYNVALFCSHALFTIRHDNGPRSGHCPPCFGACAGGPPLS